MKKAASEGPHRVGEVRPTQVMHTFGVGSIVDLPHISALVMGLDDWRVDQDAIEITEDRLLRAVRYQLGPQVQRLLTPPIDPDGGQGGPFDDGAHKGIPVGTFPRWMHCPRCDLLAPLETGLFKLNPDVYRPDRTCYVHTNCNKAAKPPNVIPARFLVACENGHLDDFPWIEFVHGGLTSCPGTLRLRQIGVIGEASDILLECQTCKQTRTLSEAFGVSGKKTMPLCRGRRPHLRDFDPDGCKEQVRAILLGASNLWFADVISTLAIPTASAKLAQKVEEKWAVLQHVTNVAFVAFSRSTGQLGDLAAYSDQDIWDAIEARREQLLHGTSDGPTDLTAPEWEVLTHPASQPITDDFRLREVAVPVGFAELIEAVVLVERVREVKALVGFTRIDAPGELDESPDAPRERRMRLARHDPKWVPASEVRGEGIFLHFREDALSEWLGRDAVKESDEVARASHRQWRKARQLANPDANYPGMRYALLHSFAHSLMRQLALECGYAAASVNERIYARDAGDPAGQPMAGVLIYTGAPDSEGTLGGLVSLGQPSELRRLLLASLHDARSCGSDPLCAEHTPDTLGLTLHGAACHSCLFAPETSCERGNRYLDRAVLVPTVATDEEAGVAADGLAFFARISLD